ncbi:MAG: 2-isopropylmalate synthase [Verrucomicrobia bacterium]|nr:MAG: 2-isopropylmalate synthase [Verrucomicrobiota bacterium]
MQKEPIVKYQPIRNIDLPDRHWPSKLIDRSPFWCSVDLRDGNQALAIPMGIEEKLELFRALVQIGFKEIEVGFPSASAVEFAFIRRLIEEGLIPEDVTIQVLTQSREGLIRRTFESIKGARRAIVHLYNSISPAQRRLVFGLDRDGIRKIATDGTRLIKSLVPTVSETEVVFEYSPESFSSTEIDYSLEVCEAVTEIWDPTPENRIILNLPATVEVATPNVHADQIEWFCRNMKHRDRAIISLHTHNDRGTGIAATELGLLAGADRVEGTLFGNGERTGNVDIVTIALNMYSQGVNPGLDFTDINRIRELYERCTRMEVPPRHPYGGELVFTAFSGSHQDAINKGLAHQTGDSGELWEVPYLPIDPKDIGRNYRAIIRINSQSGKGGIAYIMDKTFGFQMPKPMHKEFGQYIARIADQKGLEITPDEVYSAFMAEYIERDAPFSLHTFRTQTSEDRQVDCWAKVVLRDTTIELHGSGNGPIDAFVHALLEQGVRQFDLVSYNEHSLGTGADSKAVAYIEIRAGNGQTCFGAGMDTNIDIASINAVLSALNRASANGIPVFE